MKTKEIKELSTAELKERIAVESANLNRMELNHSISPLDKPTDIKEARKTIARLNTELTKRTNENKDSK